MLLFLTGLTGFFYFILFYPVILSKTLRLFMDACRKPQMLWLRAEAESLPLLVVGRGKPSPSEGLGK